MRRELIFAAVILACSCGRTTRSEVEETGTENLEDKALWQEERGDWLQVETVSLDPGNDTGFIFELGEGIWVNGSEGKTIDLHSSVEHGDAEIHIEFMVPKGSNSGVYLQSRYEVQIFDSWQVQEPKYSDCGGIYQRWKRGQGFEGHAPRLNASRPLTHFARGVGCASGSESGRRQALVPSDLW